MKFPGSGKSYNKSNGSGANAPGHSAACSLFGPPAGLCMAGRQMRGICPTADHTTRLPASPAAAPRGCSAAELRGPVRATFRGGRGDAHAQVTAQLRKSPSAGLSPVAAGDDRLLDSGHVLVAVQPAEHVQARRQPAIRDPDGPS